MNKFLVGCFAVETKNARLNGSCKDVEKSNSTLENIAYTKKIISKNGIHPYMSAQKIKYTIKNNSGLKISNVKQVNTKEAVSEGNPYINFDEDVMGFMIAQTLELSKEEYDDLSDIEKKFFTKSGKKYKKNITKKRRSRFMLSPLQAINHTKIQTEFCTKMTDKQNLIYSKEVYSTVMSAGFCLDVENVGKFNISEDSSGFRDYESKEVDILKVEVKNNAFELPKEEKEKRIIAVLKGIQYLWTHSCQNNNYEDIGTKFVILADYKIGHGIFNNIFRNGNLDINYLVEAIKENEDFRISDIYIGIRSGFMDDVKKELEDEINRHSELKDCIVIGTVKEVFNNYIENMKI